MSLHERLAEFQLKRERARAAAGEGATGSWATAPARLEAPRAAARREEPAHGAWRALAEEAVFVFRGGDLVDVRLSCRLTLPKACGGPLGDRTPAPTGREAPVPAAAAAGAPSPPPLQPLLALARPRGLDRWPQPALWFDLETTGLGGGAGVRAFLVGVARLEGQELAVRQHVLPDLDREAAFLEEVARDLAAPSWVTYNGRTFDAPLLRDRCTLHGVEPPAPLLELDLLPAARAVWRRRLGSAALSRLATEVLGLPPEDGPGGGEMPALYAAFLAEGDPFWLAGAVQHNRVDLLALASLTWELAAALEDPPPSWPAPDLIGLARLAERCGRLPAALLALERAARRAERPGERAAALAALARLHKRGRRYGAAAALLEEAVAAPVLPSLTHLDELAKLQEHRLGDLHRALALTERALRLLTLQGEGRAALARAAWERRRARLLRRLARAAAGSGRGRRPG